MFFIYNPFVKKINKKLKFKFKIINKIKDLKRDKFDLIYFGSCLQYIKNLQDIGNLNFIKKTNYILISHTPIALGNDKIYQENQINAQNLIQNIHSYGEISKKLLKNRFNLKFKSINEFKYSGLKKKKKNVFFFKFTFQK